MGWGRLLTPEHLQEPEQSSVQCVSASSSIGKVATMSLLVWNLSKKCPYLAQMMSKAGKNESISAVNCFTSTMQLCKINSNPCLLILVIKNRFQIFIWSVWPTFTSFNISHMKTCSSAPKSTDDKRANAILNPPWPGSVREQEQQEDLAVGTLVLGFLPEKCFVNHRQDFIF